MVAYHANDGFECPDGYGRLYYYYVEYVPTAIFGGKDWVVGANPNSFNVYNGLYSQHIAVNTPGILSLKIGYYNPSTRTGEIIAKMNSVDQILESDLHLRYAVAESHKFQPWQWLDSLHFIVRDMLPDSLGVAFSLNQGETFVDTQSFYISPSWADQNCDLVVFVQSDKDTSVLISNLIPLYQKHVSGDANSDGVVTVSDVVYLTNYVLYSGPQPQPSAAGDPNEDCVIDTQDMVYLVNYILNGGPVPLRGWEID
ncbi:MAG: hypothetical protein GTO24_28155 [candidate division Zixibacteria bacterium]|nr:hypothetical protein [candidate division Zixibacteria bacterium]